MVLPDAAQRGNRGANRGLDLAQVSRHNPTENRIVQHRFHLQLDRKFGRNSLAPVMRALISGADALADHFKGTLALSTSEILLDESLSLCDQLRVPPTRQLVLDRR